MSTPLHRIRAAFVTSLVLAISSLAPGQQLLRTTPGAAAGDGFGVVRPAGDVDHDGHPDLVAGAPHHATSAGADAGQVLVLSGLDGSTLLTLSGSAPGELFGSSCAGAGDVNGDGRDDLLIGAPGSCAMPGRVVIVSGADGAVLRTFTGSQAGGGFGAAVAGGADLDGDGKPDIVVGAPRQDIGGTDTGSAYAFSGATGAQLHVLTGANPGNLLGGSIDVKPVIVTQMGDNEPSIIIGCTHAGAEGAGSVIALSKNFLVLHTFTGASAGGALGASVAFAGDMDGDGVSDLVAGAAGGAGSVSAWSGKDYHAIASINAPLAGVGFGSLVAAVGDVNGDGRADFGVGEPLADAQGTDSGSVRIYSGKTGAQLHLIHGPGPGARFGAFLAAAGDISGDLLSDFAVGTPGDATGGAASGAVYVLSLTRWEDVADGLPGIDGIPRLTGQGGLVAQTEAALSLTAARPVTGATIVLGYSLKLDAAAGMLVPSADIVTSGLLTGLLGNLDYKFTWPSGVPSGFTCYYQFVINDPAAPGGQSRSNAVAAKVP